MQYLEELSGIEFLLLSSFENKCTGPVNVTQLQISRRDALEWKITFSFTARGIRNYEKA
jgi:hypothetical protein